MSIKTISLTIHSKECYDEFPEMTANRFALPLGTVRDKTSFRMLYMKILPVISILSALIIF
jgi:hypothetical protein